MTEMSPLEEIRTIVGLGLQGAIEFGAQVELVAQRKEQEGYRVIDGGSIRQDEQGRTVWEYTDWRTGEVLASGVGEEALREFEDASDPKWWHVDALWAHSPTSERLSTSLPASLVDDLRVWSETYPEDAVQFLEQTETLPS